jgi:phosphatidylserine synthase
LETNYNLNFYHPLSDQFIDILAQERKWDASDAVVLRMMFSPLFYQITAVCLSFLMVSKIPMISLKFKGFSWAKNKWKYSLLIWVLICYLIFLVPYLSLPFSWGLIDYLILPIFMIGYFILSVIYSIFAASNESTISDEIQS